MTAPRFELSGPMTPSGPPGPGNPSNPPALVLTFNANATFDVEHYMDLGYTKFDAICIGGGGGPGGGIHEPWTSSGGTGQNNIIFGGAGGGGGIQRVKGYLGLLGPSVPIVVGQGGAPGVASTSTSLAAVTDGSDGGPSSFGTSCKASGGKGGKKVNTLEPPNAPYVSLTTNGGAGGLGGTLIAGGGGAGGLPEVESPATAPPVAAVPGSWDPNTMIGGGGGGGSGGYDYANVSATQGIGIIVGTDGAGGAFNAIDSSVYSPGGTKATETIMTSGAGKTVPGYGGGAKATPVNGLPTTYGDSGPLSTKPETQVAGKNGVVVVKLTAS